MAITEELKMLSPAETKNATIGKGSADLSKKDDEQPKAVEKKSPTVPAPFYDELHYADYE